MRKRWGIAVAAWLVAAALTVVIGMTAIDSLSDGLFGAPDQPLSRQNVESQLSGSPSPAASSAAPTEVPPADDPTPEPSGTTQPPQAESTILATAGGTIIASCANDLVTLQSWSPAQGYRTDKVDRGPARQAFVRFERGSNRGKGGGDEIRAVITCDNGRPVASVSRDD